MLQSPPLKKKNSISGFMLLEVILSIFIVTVGIVFVISSFMTSIKAFKASKTYLDIFYLMEERMWGYEEKGKIEEGSDSGGFEDYENAEWSVKAEEIEDLPLNEMTIEVAVKKNDKRRGFRIVTYFRNEK